MHLWAVRNNSKQRESLRFFFPFSLSMVLVHFLLRSTNRFDITKCALILLETSALYKLFTYLLTYLNNNSVWRRGATVRASDSQSRGRGFDSLQFRFHATTLGKLFTHICLCPDQYSLLLARRRWCSVARKLPASLGNMHTTLYVSL